MTEDRPNGSRRRRESSVSDVSDEDIGNLIPTPPDGGWGWMIVLCSFLCNVIVDGIGYAFGVLLPHFADYFNESRSKVSLVGSLLCGVYLCAGPIVSGLTNKFGCRPVAICGSVIASLGFLIGSFSPNLDILILTYGFFGGFGFGLIYLPSIVSVGYYFEKKRALATGIAVCGSGVGTFIFSPANNILLETYDWWGLLIIHSGIILQCAICGMLMRPLEAPRRQKKVLRSKSVLDRVKEEAKYSRKRANESESSVAVMETFAKLREAKLKREEKLNEGDSDVGSMPSAYFVKGPIDGMSTSRESHQMKLSFSDRGDVPSGPSSPINNPKIVISDDVNGSVPTVNNEGIESPTSDISEPPLGSVEVKKDAEENGVGDGEKENENNGNLLNGIMAHEVQPLIENGYKKNEPSPKARQRKSTEVTNSKLRVGSTRDMVIHRDDYRRPLYRKDIFYSGSIVNIPQYRSQPDVKSYVASITSIPGDMDEPVKSTIWDNCVCLPKSVVDTLSEMLDVSLFTNFPFLMICIGNIFAMTGFYVPFTYIVDRATMLGIAKTDAAFLLSVIGITNTIGRVLAGFLADMPRMDALVINNVALIISSAALLLEPLCTTYELLIVFCCVYGLCVAAYISLTSIIICDLLGLSKLTNAFGLLTMARGIAGIYGPPVAGMVFQAFGSYDASFIMGGIMFLIGTGFHLLLHLPCVKRKGNPVESESNVMSTVENGKTGSKLSNDEPVAV